MSHQLLVPEDTSFDDVAVLVQNRCPEAEVAPRRIQITEKTSLLHHEEEPRLFRLETPIDRRDVPEPGRSDRDGLARAFPEALPFGEEMDMVLLLVAIARRVGGAVGTDTGHEIAPGESSSTDLRVVTTHWIESGHVRELVKPFLPEMSLDSELLEQDPNRRAPYRLSSGLIGASRLAVEVAPDVDPVVALAGVPWAQSGTVSYMIRFEPENPDDREVEEPGHEQSVRRDEARNACAAVARVLFDEVHGVVIDQDGFLVNPDDL